MSYGQNIPAPVRALLDFIAIPESGGDYNVVYKHKQGTLGKPITMMTLDELLAAQRVLGKKYGSSAAGKFQHIRVTLKAQAERLRIPGNTLFSPGLQDDLGWDLLRQRGLDRFLAGTMSRTDFGNAIAKEWASSPVLSKINGKSRGQSYYAGDGLNVAGRNAGAVEAMLDKVLAMHRASPARAEPELAPELAIDTPDEPDAADGPQAAESGAIRLRWVVVFILAAAVAAMIWRALM